MAGNASPKHFVLYGLFRLLSMKFAFRIVFNFNVMIVKGGVS